ncbi:MAG TPA: hypothetical protein VIG47_01235 [Gemmatimonadaceae bacterium]|jgi:hypothetical protein
MNEQNECLMRIRKSLSDIENEAACLDVQEAMALDRLISDGRAVIRQARKRMREEQEARAQE